AVRKFAVQFLTGERPFRSASIPIVGRLDQRPAVQQVDFDDAANLVEALCLDLGIEDAGDALHHPLYRLASDELVGEFADACLPPDEDRAHQERNAELCFELSLRALVSERLQNVRAGAQANGFDLLGLDVVI